MPIFEYQCKECNTKFEVLHKSISNLEEVVCPKCQSKESKKLFSSFSASISGSSSSSYESPCASGNCGLPSYSGGGCANGMCGL